VTLRLLSSCDDNIQNNIYRESLQKYRKYGAFGFGFVQKLTEYSQLAREFYFANNSSHVSHKQAVGFDYHKEILKININHQFFIFCKLIAFSIVN